MAGSDSKSDAKVAVLRARQLLQEKRYADALQVCTDELARGRDDPQLRLIAAHSLLAQGRHEGAKKEAQLVIRLDPRQTEAHRVLADIACSRGELATACEHLERVLDLDPDDQKSKSLLETLSRPSTLPMPGEDEDEEQAGRTPTPLPASAQTRLNSSSLEQLVKQAEADMAEAEAEAEAEFAAPELGGLIPERPGGARGPEFRREESAPALELSEDDLLEDDEDDEARDVHEEETRPGPSAEELAAAEEEEEQQDQQPSGQRLFPMADEPHVDPFSGEIFQVTDSMIQELPKREEPKLEIRAKDEAPPPGLRTEHDLKLADQSAPDAAKPAKADEDQWRPAGQGQAMDAGAGGRKYQATLRLPSLDELPDDEEAPTMPLLRPSAPPAPQLRLDPLASKPVSHEKQASRLPPPPEAQARGGLGAPRESTLPVATEPPSPARAVIARVGTPPSRPAPRPAVDALADALISRPPADDTEEEDEGFEEFGVEPASMPLAQPEPQPIPRHTLDPLKARGAIQDVRDVQDLEQTVEGVPDPFMLMTAAGADPSGPVPRDPSFPSVPADGLMGMLSGDASGSQPVMPVGGEEPSEDDFERQMAAAAVSQPMPETEGRSLRWVLIALIGLVIGGGGLAGYLWYRSYKYVQSEWSTFRQAVHLSTPEGYRRARKAAKRILDHRKRDPKASAGLAMCDAAMSIEFGDDQIKAARATLEEAGGKDSEWRTAANAFIALMDDPARAAGYLQHGLEVYPDSAILHYLKGRALAASGSPERAAEAYQAALKQAPKFVAAQTALAELVGQSESRFDEAVQMLDTVLSSHPNNAQALIERARLRVHHNKELSVAADDARRVTGELAEKSGKGQKGWAHLVLARAARLGNQHGTSASELNEAAASPPCCDSSFRYELAGELLASFRMTDAYTQMAAALELKPKQPEYLQRMARVLLELDDPGQAATYIKAAPVRALETRFLQGWLHLSRRRYRSAADALQKVLAEEKKHTEAAILLALAHARQKRSAEAIRALERLAKEQPQNHRIPLALAQVYFWERNYAKTHAALKVAWATTKADPRVPTLAGDMYLAQHDAATALKRYERALRIRSAYRPARLGAARVLLSTGQLAEAKKQLRQLQPIDQKKPDVYAVTAQIELAEGSIDAARTSVEQAANAGAAKAMVLRLGGEVALARKKPAEALDLLQQAIKRGHPRDAEMLALLGRAQLAAGRIDDAYDTFHQALRQDDGDPETLLALGRIAIRDGEFPIAIGRFNTALTKIKERMYPSSMSARAHAALGWAYLRRGDTGRAITNLQDAIDLDPNAAEPHDLMGQTYDKLDRPQRAVNYYAKAIQLDPNLIDVYERLGHAYLKSGDKANALRYFQDFLNRNPPADRAQSVVREVQKLQGQ